MNNLVLATMSEAGRAILAPHLEQVELSKRRNLELVRRPIEYVYFLETGVAAVVSATDHKRIAVGLIGWDGASGIGVFMGDDRSPHACEMLTDGSGLRIPASDLKTLIREHDVIRTHLTRYALAFYNQAAHTALSNASSAISRRIARWLLMMRDRLPDNDIPLTHHTISDMLDIRRPGVTIALKELGKQNLVEMKRGIIFICDREGLEVLASDFYGLPEMEYQRLMGITISGLAPVSHPRTPHHPKHERAP